MTPYSLEFNAPVLSELYARSVILIPQPREKDLTDQESGAKPDGVIYQLG
jgi:hypothetical protein